MSAFRASSLLLSTNIKLFLVRRPNLWQMEIKVSSATIDPRVIFSHDTLPSAEQHQIFNINMLMILFLCLASPTQEEKKSPLVKQTPVQGQDKHPKMRKRRGFLERYTDMVPEPCARTSIIALLSFFLIKCTCITLYLFYAVFSLRVMFACSVCKFRSFYKEEMETHLESRFHKDHFKFLSGQLSKPTTDFLEVTQICEILY